MTEKGVSSAPTTSGARKRTRPDSDGADNGNEEQVSERSFRGSDVMSHRKRKTVFACHVSLANCLFILLSVKYFIILTSFQQCPVCEKKGFGNANKLAEHVEQHFLSPESV